MSDEPPPEREHHPLTATFAGEGKLAAKTKHHDPYGRLLAEKLEGRPRNFDAATAARMQAALQAFLIDQIIFTGRNSPPKRQDRLVKDFIRELMTAESVDSSPVVIDRQIVRPVYQKLLGENC